MQAPPLPPKPPPQLPHGTSSVWGGISENFEFHSSPETFLASRLGRWQRENPGAVARRAVVCARILNRNVAIVSSYRHVEAVLGGDEEDKCVAFPAYEDLMAPFFPPPNLLLADGCPHARMRGEWEGRMGRAGTWLRERARLVVDEFLSEMPLGVEVDLYKGMKSLAWRVLLDSFLGLGHDDRLFAEVQRLQEVLLRGQFSLFPASVSVGFWQSPRKRGIEVRKSLQALIKELLSAKDQASKDLPFVANGEHEIQQIADHILMMTSSLAVKGFASLLTAYMLNLLAFCRDERPLCQEIMHIQDQDEQRRLLRAIYLETERLSPPVVGIMRHATKDIILEGGEDEADTLIPQGWDVWFYFVGATRDEAAFGEDCEIFDHHRYLNAKTPQPFGFGLGQKTCLGQSLMRDLCTIFAEHLVAKQMTITVDECKPGVRAWLGWEVAGPEVWAVDMKQLPTQHPKSPIIVKFASS